MRVPIPVTVIGGYLGSGKTTLLNHVLRLNGDKRIAVLVNDFGEIGIDGDLIAADDGDTITLTNGCVCCSIGGDLMTAMWSVRDRDVPPDRLIIEASGIADPAPIAHHALTPGFDLDGVVVLLDAETVRRRERHPVVGRTIRRQLAGADILVLNKIDLVSAGQLADLDAWLTQAAPGVPVLHARNGGVPLPAVLGLDSAAPKEDRPADHGNDYLTLHAPVDRPVARARLERLLDELPDGVLRVKGILRLEESPTKRTIVHRVATRSSIATDVEWSDGQAGRIVVIALAGTAGLDDATRLVNQLFS